MEPEFWLARWEAGQTGFHREEVNPLLLAHWDALGVPEGGAVFVPLCGKSRDMAWLAGRGHPVVGVELSPIAVRGFFAEHGLEPAVRRGRAHERHAAGGVTLLLGDYFALEPGDLGPVAAVYDRAALVALPEAMRPRYVAHLARLAPRARILLVTMEYPAGEMEGPPFSVPPAEVERLYGRHWRVRPLATVDALAESPNLRERGLTALAEHVLALEPRERD